MTFGFLIKRSAFHLGLELHQSLGLFLLPHPFLLQQLQTQQFLCIVKVPLGGSLHGSLVYKYALVGVMPVIETIYLSYIESFYYSPNIHYSDFLIPAGGQPLAPPLPLEPR